MLEIGHVVAQPHVLLVSDEHIISNSQKIWMGSIQWSIRRHLIFLCSIKRKAFRCLEFAQSL